MDLGCGAGFQASVAFPCIAVRIPWLVDHGYVQIGRPATGSHDPVCFDYSEIPPSWPLITRTSCSSARGFIRGSLPKTSWR